jgi:hypothetical protein
MKDSLPKKVVKLSTAADGADAFMPGRSSPSGYPKRRSPGVSMASFSGGSVDRGPASTAGTADTHARSLLPEILFLAHGPPPLCVAVGLEPVLHVYDGCGRGGFGALQGSCGTNRLQGEKNVIGSRVELTHVRQEWNSARFSVMKEFRIRLQRNENVVMPHRPVAFRGKSCVRDVIGPD